MGVGKEPHDKGGRWVSRVGRLKKLQTVVELPALDHMETLPSPRERSDLVGPSKFQGVLQAVPRTFPLPLAQSMQPRKAQMDACVCGVHLVRFIQQRLRPRNSLIATDIAEDKTE